MHYQSPLNQHGTVCQYPFTTSLHRPPSVKSRRSSFIDQFVEVKVE